MQTLELRSELAEIERLAAFIESFGEAAKLGPDDVFSLQLALEEAATNVITHGYGAPGQVFTVTLAAGPDAVTATLSDTAAPYDPLARADVVTNAPLEDRAVGGLGVHLLKRLMHRAEYERRGDTNVLTLTRNLAPRR